MAMNRELMRRVADHIERHPESHSQIFWMAKSNGHTCSYVDAVPATRTVIRCGAVCCIAGWAVALTPKKDRPKNQFGEIDYAAKKLLGLTDMGASVLFDSGWKPPEGVSVPDQLRAYASKGKVFQV